MKIIKFIFLLSAFLVTHMAIGQANFDIDTQVKNRLERLNKILTKDANVTPLSEAQMVRLEKIYTDLITELKASITPNQDKKSFVEKSDALDLKYRPLIRQVLLADQAKLFDTTFAVK